MEFKQDGPESEGVLPNRVSQDEEAIEGIPNAAKREHRTHRHIMVASKIAAIPKLKQQLEIVRSIQRRLDSSLFDIKAMVQADFYDNELHAAADLNKRGFFRAAGALAGVVLEGHLQTVFANHSLAVPKKATLGILIEDLKKSGVLDIPLWRFLQHLTDVRNLCDHKLDREPTREDVEQLIEGVQRAIKTIF